MNGVFLGVNKRENLTGLAAWTMHDNEAVFNGLAWIIVPSLYDGRWGGFNSKGFGNERAHLRSREGIVAVKFSPNDDFAQITESFKNAIPSL